MTQEEWLKVGKHWRTTSSKTAVLFHALDKLLPDIEGKTILDVGCGDGFGVRRYARKGAICTGVDISPEQIEACKAKDSKSTYLVMDAKELDLKGEFDYVLSLLVLLSFKKAEMVAILKNMAAKGKKVIVATTHPAFDHVNDNMETMTREIEDYEYTKKGIPVKYKHKTKDIEFVDLHWMIEDYVECIAKSGLLIERILEPLPVPESEKDNPAVYKGRVRHPPYIIFVCKR